MKERKCIIFDIDGTLTNSEEGILNSVKYALEQFGLEADMKTLRTFIGPPLAHSLKKHTKLSDDEITEAVRIYRDHFARVGFFQNHLYPGIWELLEDLAKAGKVLAVATNRIQPEADKVVRHLKLDTFFPPELVVGAPLRTEDTDKAKSVAAILQRTACRPEEAVMVGDREFDLLAAKANGVAAVAVMYGFGSPEEIQACHPEAAVGSVEELRRLLLG